MKKGLIWGTGRIFQETICTVKYYELIEKFKITAVTSNQYVYKNILEYNYVPYDAIKADDYDFVIIMAEGKVYKSIVSDALKLNFKPEQLIMSRVLKNPLFDIDKYLAILKQKPTIFANNCWGGVTYHQVGLEFTSPTVNLWFSEDDYIKLLKNPKFYMKQELKFDKWSSRGLKREYPIVKCGDIFIHFIHYNTFEEAREKWEKRKQRINWDNIIAVMYTDSHETEECFNDLPYEKSMLCAI